MYCKKCGNVNDNCNYCVYCGSKLKEIHNSIIRRGIKKYSKNLCNGNLILLSLFFFILIGFFLFISSKVDNMLLTCIFFIFSFIILLFYRIVINRFSLDISRGYKVTFKQILKIGECKKSVLNYCLGMIIFIAFIVLLLLSGMFMFNFFILLIFCFLYFLPVFDTFFIMLVDDVYKYSDWNVVFNEAYDLVKGHRVEYYGMILSFTIFWLFLILTGGVFAIWLIPYIRLSVVNMYRFWRGETDFSGNIGLSNGAVIGINCWFIFVFIIITFVSLVFYICNTNDFNHKESFIFKNGSSEITIIVPDDFKMVVDGSYVKKFSNNRGSLKYELKAYSNIENRYNVILNYFKGISYEASSKSIDGKDVKVILSNKNNGYCELYALYPVSDNSFVEIYYLGSEYDENFLDEIINFEDNSLLKL